MKQEELTKACSDLLYKLCDLVESRNNLNYYDINISSESFFIPLLNTIFDCDLKNMNSEKKNATAIDLYDSNGKIAIQVTSNNSADKIHTTLKSYRKNKLYEKYERLIFVVIVRSHMYRADFTNDIDGEFSFSKGDDIYTINTLIKAISALNIEKIASIKSYLEYQLDTLFDESQVSSIEQCFDYISQNTNGILNESFFEIDSDKFISEFQTKLDTSTVIHISSLSAEEGRYCVLNLLHKICTNKRVCVVNTKEAWDNAGKHLSNCILIPWFQADEIPVVPNNITVFIYNSDDSLDSLKLPQRTINFLSNKLQETGLREPYKLLRKTHGLYYFLKKELFTGEMRHPRWAKDNDRAVLVATLLGKWTECDGDKTIIEKLYGNSYDQFVSYLVQYMGIEDALIIRKNDYPCSMIYELADSFLAVYSHRSVVGLHLIEDFFVIAKTVISEYDHMFDEPFDKHFYLATLKKTRYSDHIKQGLARTLILLALHTDCQERISHFVRDLLSMLKSIKDWAYISQFIELLCEAAPDEVVNCLECNIDNHTGLLDLFTAEKSDFLFGRHYYTKILWCLENLLSFKDYAVRVVRLLFELGEKIDNCSTGNNPRDDISKVFCTWYNVSALEIEDKIELAKTGIEKYPFFWEILFNEFNNNTTIFANSSFIYRKADEIIQYNNEDRFRLYVSFVSILIDNIGDDHERLIKILDLLPKCTDELFIVIQKELMTTITKLNDYDKERIKTTLRKIIYRHRRFANSEWAAPAERIGKIEEICLGIAFDDKAYDFLYLTEPSEIPILNPVEYKSKGRHYQENERAIKKTIASEISRFKDLDIDLGHYLGLRKIASYIRIGVIIAKYYCNSKLDLQVMETIISTCTPQIAIDYVYNCTGLNLSELYVAVDYLRRVHYGEDVYIAVLATLPFDEKLKPLICELPEEAAKNYWRRFTRYNINNRDLLIEAVENLLRFGNFHELYYIMYKQESFLNTDEILAILSESTRKMDAENYQISNNDSYILEQVLSVLYNRIGNSFERYPALFELEMFLSDVIRWDGMRCCQYLFRHNANLYADILSLVYPKDGGVLDDTLDHDQRMHIYNLERDIKFCPGEEDNSINRVVLDEWINVFKSRLESQGQTSLLYRKLGKLFACSPEGIDGISPHEIIREKIEEFGNDELINSFALAIVFGRGMYNVTGGKDEYKLGQKYREISRKLSIRYPKTSKIFDIISRDFFRESEHERKRAENELF